MRRGKSETVKGVNVNSELGTGDGGGVVFTGSCEGMHLSPHALVPSRRGGCDRSGVRRLTSGVLLIKRLRRVVMKHMSKRSEVVMKREHATTTILGVRHKRSRFGLISYGVGRVDRDLFVLALRDTGVFGERLDS